MFLTNNNKSTKFLEPGLILILVLVLAALSVWVKPVYLLGVLICLTLLLFFIKNLNWGIYLIALLYPFIYLQLWISSEMHVPYVDLIAIFVFAAWFIKSLYLWLTKKQKLTFKSFPGLFYFILFIIAACLSLTNIENVGLGIKYILRPLVFFYLMFVILPYNAIDSKKTLFNVFKILYAVGLVVAGMGLWSIIFPQTPGLFRRAVPIAIFGISTLGSNHNLIAEALISIIPIGFILIWHQKNELFKKWLILGLVLMMVINLLTLSRTGWICLFFELLILAFVLKRQKVIKLMPYLIAILVIILPLVYYMFQFLDTSFVASSNMNRLQQTQIAMENFKANPWVGAGIGTFIEQVGQDKWYILDFGSPSEAHGVVQKLLAETGILGLLTFFALLIYVLARIIKAYLKLDNNSPWKMIILALILTSVGSVVFQLFNTSYYVSKLWFPLGIALTAGRLALKEKYEIKN